MAATSFDASVVPQAPEDPLFGLMAAYRRDNDPKKVDLGIGAYRDNNAKPWILPVVKKVKTTRPCWSSRFPPLAPHTPGAPC
jgi:aspartate aminotransferase